MSINSLLVVIRGAQKPPGLEGPGVGYVFSFLHRHRGRRPLGSSVEAAEGGESIVMDGFAAAEALKAEDPEAR